MQNIMPATTRKDRAHPSMDVTELDNVLQNQEIFQLSLVLPTLMLKLKKDTHLRE
jgi:hypothetical protein